MKNKVEIYIVSSGKFNQIVMTMKDWADWRRLRLIEEHNGYV